MSDCKIELVKSLETSLSTNFTQEQIAVISETLIKKLVIYDVIELCREIIPYESINERLLKQYCACLFVDGKSEKTIYQYRYTLIKLLSVINKPFTEMGVYDIRYFLACEKERGVSGRSVENTRANLSAFFQWMTKEEIIPKNPCMNINPIKFEDTIRKPFSAVEIDKLRSACKNKKERAIVEFLLSSGVRVSELSNLKISDINLQELLINVVCGKGGKSRITYITDVARNHLENYWDNRKDSNNFAFCNSRLTQLEPGGIRYILNKIGKQANVKNVHPHRFRRTFASTLASKGMDICEIQKLLGHSNISTTMEYVHVDDKKVKTSYQRYAS